MVVLAQERVLPAGFEAQAARIVQILQQQAERFSAIGDAPKISMDDIRFNCVTDPSNQQAGYEGIWRNRRGDRCGSLTFNSDGSFYAEYDLFCPHPRDERWFVEMVTAWGAGEKLHSEVKLIPRM